MKGWVWAVTALALGCADGGGTDETVGDVDGDADGVVAADDCDDADALRFPGNPEVCDGVDNDCDEEVDEGATDATAFFRDADADGFGDDADSVMACSAPSGYVAAGGDCDDGTDAMFPGAAELCDAIDNDCDTEVDEDPLDGATYFRDRDSDGFGDDKTTLRACEQPPGFASEGGDCDDTTRDRTPGQVERCDGIDNDCNDKVDDDAFDAPRFYVDADEDGFGDRSTEVRACEAPDPDLVLNGDDCDDASSAVRPGVQDVCDNVDNDCSGVVDDGLDMVSVPGTHATIVDAVGAAADGDFVCMAPGVYSESVDITKDLVFLAAEGPGTVTFDLGPVPRHPMFLIEDSVELVLREMAVTGKGVRLAEGDRGAFAYLGFGDLRLLDVEFHDLQLEVAQGTDVDGLLVASRSGDFVTLRDVDFDGIDVRFVPGKKPDSAVFSGIFLSTEGIVTLDLERVTVRGLSVRSDPDVERCIAGSFIDLRSEGFASGDFIGSGLQFEGPVIDLSCTESSISTGLVSVSNHVFDFADFRILDAEVTMRGEQVRQVSLLDCTNCLGTLTDVEAARANIDTVSDELDCQGLLGLDGNNFNVDHASVHDNVISAFGVTRTQGTLGPLVNMSDTDVRWLDVRNNVVDGGFVLSGLTDMSAFSSGSSLRNSIFVGNRIGSAQTVQITGGLLGIVGPLSSDAVVEQHDIVGNVVQGDEIDGGIFELVSGGGPSDADGHVLRNINIVGNTVIGAVSDGTLLRNRSTNFAFTHLNLFDNTFDDAIGEALSGLDASSIVGAQAVDPQYVDITAKDPKAWVLELLAGSPVIDFGDPTTFDADGTRSDIGAYGGASGDGW